MELVWMLAICLTAVTVAFIIGERIDKTVFLKLKVKDPEQLQCQLEELAKQGVAFAEGCYLKKLIRGEDVSLMAKEYMKSSLELLYKTKVVDQEGVLEEMIQETIEKDITKGLESTVSALILKKIEETRKKVLTKEKWRDIIVKLFRRRNVFRIQHLRNTK